MTKEEKALAACKEYDRLHEMNTARSALREHLIEPLAEVKSLRGAIERMRCAGGSAEFQMAFELAKDLLGHNV